MIAEPYEGQEVKIEGDPHNKTREIAAVIYEGNERYEVMFKGAIASAPNTLLIPA